LPGHAKEPADHANEPAGFTPVVLSSWTQVLVDALDAEGHDGLNVAESIGFSPSDFSNPNARFSLDQTTAFWRKAVEVTGDDALGIWVSRHVKVTTFQGLGFAVITSNNLLDAFRRMERYSQIVSDSEKAVIEDGEEACDYILEPGAEVYRASPESLDAILAHIVRFVRATVDRAVTPLTVDLARPKPKNHEAYTNFFRCDVCFGAERNRLSFSSNLVHRPFQTANPALAEQSEALLQAYMEKLGVAVEEDPIRKLIIDHLPSGAPAIGDIARDAGQSVRSLQRRLEERGLTFSQLLGDVRQERAERYLQDPDLPITEIAFLLGFQDTSSFSRAFKTWTGVTPKAFRTELRA
jgi:AraC-like DNA-binding protein